MHEFTDARIVDAKELKYQDRDKEVCLVLDLPPPEPNRWVRWSRIPEIQHVCLWSLTGATKMYADHTYHQVIGRWGPFVEAHYAALEPTPRGEKVPVVTGNAWVYREIEDPETTPPGPEPDTVGVFLDGEDRPLWRGLWSGPDPDYWDDDFVPITYSTPACGNLFRGHIEATYIERLFQRLGLDWVVVRSPRAGSATVEPRTRKPHEVGRNIYLNAHNNVTFGGHLHWQIDETGKREELWFGAYWPSKLALMRAMNKFIEQAKANPPRTVHETLTLLNPFVIANTKLLKARFPKFKVPDGLR
jgi:hypothetical protein